MNKQTTNTAEQLKALMRSHIQNASSFERQVPVMTIQKTSILPLSTPIQAPVISQHDSTGSRPVLSPRYSLRLLPSELSKINMIINSTMNATGERVTLTDILRVGLGRLGEGAPISKEEINLLRSSDGRRSKHA
jgi:hypothetical protein